VPAEAFHLKAAGKDAWHLMGPAIECIETARQEGLAITADMCTYTAGRRTLDCIPPGTTTGGGADPAAGGPLIRSEIRETIETSTSGWENLYMRGGSPDNVLILQVRIRAALVPGKTLRQVAAKLGLHPIEAIFELVVRDRSRITTAYFMMSEENVKLGLKQAWVSLGSDSPSTAAEGAFLKRSTHPRAYGNFARFLGKYVREEQVVPLGEAVRKMASLPADNMGLKDRGRLEAGRFADVVVFDPATVADRATFDDPHQYAVGVRDVVVNGKLALREGEFAGSYPGRALRAWGGA
jgi:N-acyl-D-amino-acid deacylase